jgi:hypothetical protein
VLINPVADCGIRLTSFGFEIAFKLINVACSDPRTAKDRGRGVAGPLEISQIPAHPTDEVSLLRMSHKLFCGTFRPRMMSSKHEVEFVASMFDLDMKVSPKLAVYRLAREIVVANSVQSATIAMCDPVRLHVDAHGRATHSLISRR